ncbi:MAG: NAD(P)-binding protein [Thermoplasmatales archaeon]|nr:NAD(P)-binding protein [Thermoplasmatales archaeon]
MEKIKIMGAGLSGLSAAISLAAAGYNVDVFEKRSDCGKRFQGDINGLENWSSHVDAISEFESMNIRTNYYCEPFKTLHLTNGEEVLANTFKKPFFYLLKRGDIENSLDQGLKNQALDKGVNIHFNSNVKKEDMDIISSGPEGKKHPGILKGILFETESDDIAVCLINNKTSNRGYSYLLITKGFGTICSLNLRDTNDDADAYYKKTYEVITKLFDIDIKNEKKSMELVIF